MTDARETHSPLPWYEADGLYIVANNQDIVATCDHGMVDRENISHIVRCVNSHQGLVDALKYIHDDEDAPHDVRDKVRKALKSAGAL